MKQLKHFYFILFSLPYQICVTQTHIIVIFLPQLNYYIFKTVVGGQNRDTPEVLAGQLSLEVRWVLMGPVKSERKDTRDTDEDVKNLPHLGRMDRVDVFVRAQTHSFAFVSFAAFLSWFPLLSLPTTWKGHTSQHRGRRTHGHLTHTLSHGNTQSTLSPSSPGSPAGPVAPSIPTSPCSPSCPAGPMGPFSPWNTHTHTHLTHTTQLQSHR